MNAQAEAPLETPAVSPFATGKPPDASGSFVRPIAPTTANAPSMRRIAIAIASIAGFGLALGAHRGGFELVQHAVMVPVGMLATLAVTAPALFIALAWMNAPIAPRVAALAVLDGFDAFAVALGGLAPACALYLVTSDTDASVVVASFALGLAGVAFTGRTLATIYRATPDDQGLGLLRMTALTLLFFSVGASFADRIFEATLPLFGGHLAVL